MKQKIYAPVTDFERQTSYCPLYLAWRILDEARDISGHPFRVSRFEPRQFRSE
jgi:hypothetical protein